MSGGSDLNEHVLTDKPNNTYYLKKQKTEDGAKIEEDTYFSNQPLPNADQSTNQKEIKIKTIQVENEETSLLQKWKKEKEGLQNPFAEYSWFHPSPLGSDEEEEAMQYEMKFFKENRVTKGANPFSKAD